MAMTPAQKKAAAGRAGKTKVVARNSTPPGFGRAPAPSWYTKPKGVAGQNQQVGATPSVDTAPAPTMTPVAPPPDPFLTPEDIGNQTLETTQWDQYLSGLGQALDQMKIDTGLANANTEQALGKGLEATDWNTAARGLQSSSIKDQAKTEMRANASRATGAANEKVKSQEGYVGAETGRVNSVVKPAIGQKWAGIATKNAQAVSDNQPPPVDTTPAGSQSAATGGGRPGPAPLPAVNPGAPTSVEQQYQPVVKGGWFYHYYPAANGQPERWQRIRRAS